MVRPFSRLTGAIKSLAIRAQVSTPCSLDKPPRHTVAMNLVSAIALDILVEGWTLNTHSGRIATEARHPGTRGFLHEKALWSLQEGGTEPGLTDLACVGSGFSSERRL